MGRPWYWKREKRVCWGCLLEMANRTVPRGMAECSEGGVKDDLGFQREPQRGQRGLIKDRGYRGPRFR